MLIVLMMMVFFLVPVSGHAQTPGLTALSINEGALSPPFDPAVLSYTVEVAHNTEEVTVQIGLTDPSSAYVQMTYIDRPSKSGADGHRINLYSEAELNAKMTPGSGVTGHVITVYVRQIPTTTLLATYTITLTRRAAPPLSTKLENLTIGPGTLSPAFDPEVNDYEVTVPYGTTTVTGMATPAEGATVAITYGTRTAPSPPGYQFDLADDVDIIRATVSAGGKTNVYNIKIEREKPFAFRLGSVRVDPKDIETEHVIQITRDTTVLTGELQLELIS